MSNKPHLRPVEVVAPESEPEPQQMQQFSPGPVPTMITIQAPDGAPFVLMIISTPQTPQQVIYIDKDAARKIGSDLMEIGKRPTISLPEPNRLFIPGQ
jgi:hypothetical protein